MVATSIRPTVSIIIPAYNAAQFLPEAVESIQAQSITDFEIILVDDLSEDGTWECIRRLQSLDRRITGLQVENKAWASGARNLGIGIARGRYIAFLDADDIALPKRLEIQTSYLDAHKEISACGSWASLFGADVSLMKFKTAPNEVAARLAFSSEFLMPSICVRKIDIQKSGYFDETLRYNEDWEWLIRVAKCGGVSNLNNVLIKYRRWPGQASAVITDTLDCTATIIRSNYLEEIGIPKGEQDIGAHIWCAPSLWHVKIVTPENKITESRVESWLQRLRPVFAKRFGKTVTDKIVTDCRRVWRQRKALHMGVDHPQEIR